MWRRSVTDFRLQTRNGGVAKWEGRGLQNLYEWVRLPPPPRFCWADMSRTPLVAPFVERITGVAGVTDRGRFVLACD